MEEEGLTGGHIFVIGDEWGASLVFELYDNGGEERVMIYEDHQDPVVKDFLEDHNAGIDIKFDDFTNLVLKMNKVDIYENLDEEEID